jgi:hypothetical protein
MNKIFEQVESIMQEKLKVALPDAKPADLEKDGAVFYMNGKIGFGTVALSWVLQAVCILALIWLAGKVYSRLIIYSGTRLKLSDILKMAKEMQLV